MLSMVISDPPKIFTENNRFRGGLDGKRRSDTKRRMKKVRSNGAKVRFLVLLRLASALHLATHPFSIHRTLSNAHHPPRCYLMLEGGLFSTALYLLPQSGSPVNSYRDIEVQYLPAQTIRYFRSSISSTLPPQHTGQSPLSHACNLMTTRLLVIMLACNPCGSLLAL